MTNNIAEWPKRFSEKVGVSAHDECWPWLAYRLPNNYGRFSWRGVPQYAHRIAWELSYGSIPDGQYVLHHCDNPRCVNPRHLFLGTLTDNAADRNAKGRQAKGEQNANSRLTAEQVLAIRSDPRSQSKVAAAYGIRQSHVSDIRRRKLWQHI